MGGSDLDASHRVLEGTLLRPAACIAPGAAAASSGSAAARPRDPGGSARGRGRVARPPWRLAARDQQRNRASRIPGATPGSKFQGLQGHFPGEQSAQGADGRQRPPRGSLVFRWHARRHGPCPAGPGRGCQVTRRSGRPTARWRPSAPRNRAELPASSSPPRAREQRRGNGRALADARGRRAGQRRVPPRWHPSPGDSIT